ncbi:hypothetical protein NDU88_006731 [Pleurodeles waltl]|uniref:Uncharacterized protein n=1 Tax=Pleurodeles waltl TaxID=8319 RepID=A0AAV7NUA9_PLEWA|nr:hypothetical protein NDU88_006731 [Pleurodeles waltl]
MIWRDCIFYNNWKAGDAKQQGPSGSCVQSGALYPLRSVAMEATVTRQQRDAGSGEKAKVLLSDVNSWAPVSLAVAPRLFIHEMALLALLQ